MKKKGLLRPIKGKPFQFEKGTVVYYRGVAVLGDTIHRIRFEGGSGKFNDPLGRIVEADKIEKN